MNIDEFCDKIESNELPQIKVIGLSDNKIQVYCNNDNLILEISDIKDSYKIIASMFAARNKYQLIIKDCMKLINQVLLLEKNTSQVVELIEKKVNGLCK